MSLLPGNLILHPALLLASGVESLTSRDIRFLNAYRRHFEVNQVKLDKIVSISERDFFVGGILNPINEFFSPENAYCAMLKAQKCRPYMSYHEIYRFYYADYLSGVFSNITKEILRDIANFYQEVPGSTYNLKNERIRMLNQTIVYPKIVALHLCGLGAKLSEAFEFMFDKYDDHLQAATQK